MSETFGTFSGCHRHTEGNVPVNRRWLQWHKQGTAPSQNCTCHTRTTYIWSGQGHRYWHTYFMLFLKQSWISDKPVFVFDFVFSACHIVCFFPSDSIFSAVYEQIQYDTESVWFHTLGTILHTHCGNAVNSQNVLRISAVFGPTLELTQETRPFWQPPASRYCTQQPRNLLLHTHT